MLKRLWLHLTAIPENLDARGKFLIYSTYFLLSLFVVYVAVLLLGAFWPGPMSLSARLLLVGIAFAILGVLYAYRLLIYKFFTLQWVKRLYDPNRST